MNFLVRLLKFWTLPVAIAVGTLAYLTFYYVPALDELGNMLGPVFDIIFPLFVFLTLFITFCKVDFHDMMPHRWHVGVLTAQLLLVALNIGIILWMKSLPSPLSPLASPLLWEAVLTCIIGPAASASPVVVGKLGGNISTMTTYVLISSLASALLIPLVFPMLEQTVHVAFLEAFLIILEKVSLVLLLPLVLGWLMQHYVKGLCARIVAMPNLSFYCWAISLSITTGITVKNIVGSNATLTLLLLIAVATLALCFLQFWIGRGIGRHMGEEINAGQALFQKNTALSIWVAYMYLNPVASIGAGCYVLWQNIINSMELWQYRKQQTTKKISNMKRTFMLLALLCTLTAVQAVENYPYRSDYLWVTVPDHADWLYNVGEKATVEVQFYQYGIPRDGVVEWEVGTDLLPADANGSVTLKGGRAKIQMGTAKKPCFRDLRLKMKLDGKTYEHHVKVGFSADKIQPFTQEPKDFWAFWQQNLAEAKKFPLHYSKEYVKEMSNDKVEAYRLKIDLDRERHAFYAYLLMPRGAKAGSCPVVLTPPGAGVKPIRDATTRRFYPENGFIRMALDIHGLNPTLSEEVFAEIRAAFDNKGNAYLRQSLEDRNHYYMKHVYLGLVRCIDLLTSLPEWDGKNVIMQGGSQGGALALIGTALDPRVTHCVANHPALSDMAAGSAGLTSGYPHFTKESGAYSDACMKTLPYYDVVNFARHIQVPVYMTWGYNDNTCPPTTSYAVWNVLRCEKECLLTPVNEHWTSDATDRGQMEWMRKHLITGNIR